MMNEATLVSFARNCLGPVLGEQPAGRFFLAGGAFKSLLHGLPPRDLDLWPATEADRERLAAQLVSRGAKLHRENPPYHTSYVLMGQRVELAYDSSAEDLQVQLGRFDLGLSAIGVEHRQGTWRGAIHPLALDSIRRREVLLLTPLVNWKYALATLERMRRYATELGFHVPASEEQTIWDVFDRQAHEEQQAMVARYLRVSLGSDQVLHEAQRRSRRQ
jgi:hypothetical protein